MGGNIITPRNVKYTKVYPQLLSGSCESPVNESKTSFVNSYSPNKTVQLNHHLYYIESILLLIWFYDDIVHKK
jgi:hypothetical protein